jgi:acetylglutamate kinase
VRILAKLGGTLLDADDSRKRLAEELTAVSRQHELVVVHGGGKQMTRFLTERGIESRFVDGLRVTTPEVLDAVLKIFAGTVNHTLVSSFIAAGAKAVGLTGIDALITEAEPFRADLGAVGRVVRSNGELLNLLTENRYLPVVACVAGDRQGRIFNVNADQMAVACGIACRSECLMFLTDVEGVRGKDGTKILPDISILDSIKLIDDGVASGGMQAKLNAATDALRSGVGEVVIAPGSFEGVVSKLLAGESIGTRVRKD